MFEEKKDCNSLQFNNRKLTTKHFYRNCLKLRPRTSLHTQHRRTKNYQTHSNIHGVQTYTEDVCWNDVGHCFSVPQYIHSRRIKNNFRCRQKKKSKELRFGKHGSQATVPPRPLHFPRYVASGVYTLQLQNVLENHDVWTAFCNSQWPVSRASNLGRNPAEKLCNFCCSEVRLDGMIPTDDFSRSPPDVNAKFVLLF